MADYVLEIELTVEGIKKAIEDLGLIGRGWNKKAEKVIRLSAEELADFINDQYWATEHAGSSDVWVWAHQWANHHWTVTAEGGDLYFYEFGTGIYAETDAPPGYYVDVPLGPGSYSQTVGAGNFRDDHQYWWYNHQKIEGSLGALAFDKARDRAPDIIEKHIVEVFG